MRSMHVSVFVAGLMLMVAPICTLADLGVDFAGPTADYTNDNWSLGWAFTVNEPLLVQALGFYDDQKNGLTQSHNVGIFNAEQELTVSGQVTPDDALDSWWRWTAVTPTLLETNEVYRIASVTSAENYTWYPDGFSVHPNVDFLFSVYAWTGGSTDLVWPESTRDLQGYFGPNFSFDSVAAPLPGSVVLLALGFLTVGLRRKSL